MTGKQKAILIVLLGAQFMFAVDFSILTVALPKIGDDLGFGIDSLQWVITAFALTAAGFMLLFGRIGDLYGRKKLFLFGMALLTVSSLIGGLATSAEVMLAARIAQGLATAIVTPSGMALITTSFDEGPLRTKALGLNGALLSLGFASGAILGGVLTDLLSWRWDFFINVPVGILLFFGGLVVIRESVSETRPKLDVPGAITVTGGLLAFVFGITGAERNGWAAPQTWGALLLAAVLLVGFYVVELKSAAPLAPVRILKSNSVKWGNLGGLITFSMESALSFLLTLYMQQVLELTPFQTGLMFGFLGLGAFLGGTFSSRILARIGAKGGLVWGLVIQAVMTGALFWLGDDKAVGIVAVLVTTFVGGFGHVLAIVAYTVTATSGIADGEQGLATGLATMTQQIGFTLGIPVMSAVAASQYGELTDGVASVAGVLTGTTFGMFVDGLIVLGGALLVALFLRRSEPASGAGESQAGDSGSADRVLADSR
ncbi:MFS transporter [Streptomyces sp. WMMC940]|uniref:MFS transporter n=1 Tax=Streptomyces sp. WMMC940 TaxID=3015153 RepID=UPI0022B6DEAA|nr:MFS transporter [Streptomyces sp. WMMC940]MCZ7459565.1 MFS transporter [Streptomyces sp. WMMC940]